jgi:hypothetical protein
MAGGKKMHDNYYEWFNKNGLNPIRIPSTDYKVYSVIKQSGTIFSKHCELVGTLNDYLQNGSLPQATSQLAVFPQGKYEIKSSYEASGNWVKGLVSSLPGATIKGSYGDDAIIEIKSGAVSHDEVLANELIKALENAKITNVSHFSNDIAKKETIFAIVDLWKTKDMTISIYDKRNASAEVDVDAEIAKGSVDFEKTYELKEDIPLQTEDPMPFAFKIVNVLYDRENGEFIINSKPAGSIRPMVALPLPSDERGQPEFICTVFDADALMNMKK